MRRRDLHAQAGGTPALLLLTTHVCRALEDTGTLAPFALSHGSGK